ncbi:MAG: hypothetical protein AB1611_06730 [bacterium]
MILYFQITQGHAITFFAILPKPAISLKHIGMESALFAREWKNYTFPAALDQSLILSLEEQARWIIRRDATSTRRPPDFMDFIYTGGLKAIQPEAVRIAGR